MRRSSIDLVFWLPFALLIALWGTNGARAHDSGPEHLVSFDTELTVRPDGALEIRHRVAFHPHGDEIRRGLYFELPDIQEDLRSFRATIDETPVTPEFDDGNVIVATKQPLATHQDHVMLIQYRSGIPFRRRGGEDRLDWSPVIEQFELPWRSASVVVRWPEGAAPLRLSEGGEAFEGGWRIRYSGPLSETNAADSVDTLRFAWSEGTWSDANVQRWITDWIWRGALIGALLLLWTLLHTMWRAVGRDPKIGNVPERDRAPDDISPAAARYIDRMAFDAKAFVAALVSLRMKHRIELTLDKRRKRLTIERRAHGTAMRPASPGERALESALFRDGSQVELKPGASVGQRATKALGKALGREHRGRHFQTNATQRTIAVTAGAAVSLLGLVAAVTAIKSVLTKDPVLIGLGLGTFLAGTLLWVVYFELLKAPTRAGAMVKRELAGLRKHLKRGDPANRSVRHFVELLPYAIALDLEDEWQQRFEGRLDEAEGVDVAELMRWYRNLCEEFDSASAIVPILAASAGATAATSAGAGGASAGGV